MRITRNGMRIIKKKEENKIINKSMKYLVYLTIARRKRLTWFLRNSLDGIIFFSTFLQSLSKEKLDF